MTAEKKQQGEKKDLDRMTVKELREVAANEMDLVGVHTMKKAELLSAIKEAKGIKVEKAPKKKAEKKAVTVSQLKARILELKAEKAESRKAGDEKRVAILRRRINRAKKRTRKITGA